ncbi:hypothetical protein AB0F72_19775 [Actinoplanes sp. NPDC023936]|uniref:hypothetical protein n=1 Tax=Actinoplanes sp. NPDC023936 TaxID=3154910 RepID=UPI0033C593AA
MPRGALRDTDAVPLGALGLLDAAAMATPVARMSQGQLLRDLADWPRRDIDARREAATPPGS